MGVSIRPSDFVIDEDDRVYSDYENTATGAILKTCINCKHYHDSCAGRQISTIARHICLRGKTKIIDDPMVDVCWHYKQEKRTKPFHVYLVNPTSEQLRELGLGHLVKGV